MRRGWIGAALLAALLTGCATPQRGGMTEPEMEPVRVPQDQEGGLAEPVMEASVAAPAGPIYPTMRPRSRPDRLERCGPGDDGIGGTGCRID